MSDIKKGYTFTDKSTDWASNKDTAIRLNKMMDEAKVNLVAGTNVTITPTLNGPQIDVTGAGTGSVTSIDVDGGTGISVSPAGPITTAGTFTVTNTAPDLTVVLSGGTGITTSGTYPNFTVTNSAPDQTVALTQGGTTTITGTYPNFSISSADQYTGTVTGVSVVSANGLAGSATTGATPAITLSTTVSGLVKGNGTALSAATAGTDYVIPSGSITGTAGNVTGIVAVANGGSGTSSPSLVAGTNVTITGSWPNQTINSTAGGGGGGTVTSIDVDGGTGISVTPAGPITTSGTFTVTNTAPDQTVSIASGTGISASGTYPNFTVTNTAPDQTVSISAGTNISVSGSYPSFTVASTAVAIPTTGNRYSRLRKDISGTIGSASDMSWAGPDVFNIIDYGASTSASAATNTAAIVAAFAAATISGGCVYVPQGVFNCNKITVTITENVAFIGEGQDASVLKFDPPETGGDLGLKVTVSSGGENDIRNFEIQDICFWVRSSVNGNYNAGTAIEVIHSNFNNKHFFPYLKILNCWVRCDIGAGYWSKGISMSRCHNFIIDNCFICGKVSDYVGSGIYYQDAIINGDITNCHINYWSIGVDSQFRMEGINAIANYLIECNVGFKIVGLTSGSKLRSTAFYAAFNNLDCRGTSPCCFYLKNVSAAMITNNEMVQNGGSALVDCYRVFESAFTSNTIYGPATYGIHFAAAGEGELDSISNTVVGNIFRGQSTNVLIDANNNGIIVTNNRSNDSDSDNTLDWVTVTDNGSNNLCGESKSFSTVQTLDGSTLFTFDYTITTCQLGRKPNGVTVSLGSEFGSNIVGGYDFDNSTKTTARIKIWKTDGGNLPSYAVRFNLCVNP